MARLGWWVDKVDTTEPDLKNELSSGLQQI